MDRRRQILVSGLFRSGTNYLQSLCDLNLDTDPIERHPGTGRFPYKHAAFPRHLHSHYPGLTIVMIYKSPERWIDSLCRNSFDLIDETDLAFEPGHTMIEIRCDDEFDPVSEKPAVPVSLEKLCGHYNAHGTLWETELKQYDHAVVAHSDLAADPAGTFAQMAEALGEGFSSFEDCHAVRNSRPFTDAVRASYATEGAYEYLTPDHLAVIESNISFRWSSQWPSESDISGSFNDSLK